MVEGRVRVIRAPKCKLQAGARSASPPPARHLNPVFEVRGERFVLMAQWLSAVEVRELGDCVASLEDPGEAVLGALDFLITGV